MRCELNHDTLARWFDGELDPVRARDVAAHVNACESCMREIVAWRRIDDLLTRDVDPGDLGERVAQAIQSDRPSLGWWWLKIAAAVVAAAGLGAAGAQMAFPTSAPPPQVAQLDSSLAILEAHFAPGSMAGIDQLAGDISISPGGERP